MSPGDLIRGAFVQRPKGGPAGTPQQPAYQQPAIDHPDYSLQFGGQSAPPACDPCELLQRLIQLVSANPDYYPWRNNTIPPDGKAFDIATTIAMPTMAAGETLVATFTTDPGYDAIVLGISNNTLNGPKFNAATPDLIWRIRNGVAIANSLFVDGYDYITTEFGTTEFPRRSYGIFVSTGQTLLYTVTNNSATYPADGVQTCCCFQGFQWPSQRGRS